MQQQLKQTRTKNNQPVWPGIPQVMQNLLNTPEKVRANCAAGVVDVSSLQQLK